VKEVVVPQETSRLSTTTKLSTTLPLFLDVFPQTLVAHVVQLAPMFAPQDSVAKHLQTVVPPGAVILQGLVVEARAAVSLTSAVVMESAVANLARLAVPKDAQQALAVARPPVIQERPAVTGPPAVLKIRHVVRKGAVSQVKDLAAVTRAALLEKRAVEMELLAANRVPHAGRMDFALLQCLSNLTRPLLRLVHQC
jgi:hypothetical protein